jgi:hypothetical protein
MPTQEELLAEFYNRRRRQSRQSAGGLSPAVADHVFDAQGTLLTPSPALTVPQVQAPASFVARMVSQQGLGDTVFIDTGNVFGIGFIAGDFALIAPGFGNVTPIALPFPTTSGEIVFSIGADPVTDNRVMIHMNGVPVFDDTNAGFTSWGVGGDTYSFGQGTGTDYKSFEIYLDRLPDGW